MSQVSFSMQKISDFKAYAELELLDNNDLNLILNFPKITGQKEIIIIKLLKQEKEKISFINNMKS